MHYIIYHFFYFRWRRWWGVGGVVVNWKKLSRIPILCVFHSVSNILRHGFVRNSKWVCPKCPELFPMRKNTHLTHNLWWKYDKKPKAQRNFYTWPLFFKWMWVSQSLLDYFSIGVWAFIQNIYFFILCSLCMLVSICYNFLNALTRSQSLYTFFKCLKFE